MMVHYRTLRCFGSLCRRSDGFPFAPPVTLPPHVTRNPPASLLPSSLVLSPSSSSSSPSSRFLHGSAASPASGLKDFVPKWLRRDDDDDPYKMSPEEHRGVAPKDALAVVRKPAVKFKPSYRPPDDVVAKMEIICEELFPPSSSSSAVDETSSSSSSTAASSSSIAALEFPDDRAKFVFLDKCVERFRKRVPNSYVDEIRCVGDAIDFFSRPVAAKNEILKRLETSATTPANVHAIPDYMSHEAEMELHEGRDAYPHQDIIVSDLRERGKYKSVRKPKDPWEEAKGFRMPVKYKRHQGY